MFFYLVFATLILQTLSGNPNLKCSTLDPKLYESASVLSTGTWGNSENCYFVVKNASFMVKVSDDSSGDDRFDSYKIDLNRARILCYAHQATLPIILTEGEQEFLDRKYLSVTPMMLLGMERITYQNYIWDDKNGAAFKPEKWVKITEKTTDTYTMLRTGDGGWTEFHASKTWPKRRRLPLVCQQRAYTPNDDDLPGTIGHWHPNVTAGANQARRFRRDSSGARGTAKFNAVASILVLLIPLAVLL